jgi:hypothetical protein
MSVNGELKGPGCDGRSIGDFLSDSGFWARGAEISCESDRFFCFDLLPPYVHLLTGRCDLSSTSSSSSSSDRSGV